MIATAGELSLPVSTPYPEPPLRLVVLPVRAFTQPDWLSLYWFLSVARYLTLAQSLVQQPLVTLPFPNPVSPGW